MTATVLARSILTAVAFLATATPAIALASGAVRGGIRPAIHTDLYVLSAVLATAYAVIIWRRLRRPSATNVPARRWIAAVYHVLLTALGSSLTALGYLYLLARRASDFADTQPIVILWALFLLTGIALGELAWRACIRLVHPTPTDPLDEPLQPSDPPPGPPPSNTGETETLEWVAPRIHDRPCRCSPDL